MVLNNKLGITNSAELAKQEEILTKKRAKELFESGKFDEIEIGTFKGYQRFINSYFKIFMNLRERFAT